MSVKLELWSALEDLLDLPEAVVEERREGIGEGSASTYEYSSIVMYI
jgi:hypothetical protein